MMNYVLIDMNPKMIEAWKIYFSDEDQVSIVLGDITKLVCDAIVSPANSFGFMDGGVDWYISNRLGWNLQDELQRHIKESPLGELLVGQTMTLKTGDNLIPFLISAPTMRVPTNQNIANSINAYLAMKATLIAALNNDKIKTIAITGFCTGTGGMPLEIAASQMHKAFLEIAKGHKTDFKNFKEAKKYELEINAKC